MHLKSVNLFRLVLVFAIVGLSAYPQEQQQQRPTRGSTPQGTGHLYRDPVFVPKSLAELVAHCPLIVEGMADATNIPARLAIPGNPESIESDVVFLVSNVLKGSLSPQVTFPRVVISETGGSFGGINLLPEDAPRMVQGEHYVLFLVEDKRKGIPNVAGLPRYFVAGVWSGKFKVEHNQISVPQASSQGLHAYHLMNHDVFLGQLRTAVAAAAQVAQ